MSLSEMLGEAIRRAYRRAGLRQEDLAQRVGVSQSTVSDWVNARSTPDALQLLDIDVACEQPPGEIMRTLVRDRQLTTTGPAGLETEAPPDEVEPEVRSLDALLQHVAYLAHKYDLVTDVEIVKQSPADPSPWLPKDIEAMETSAPSWAARAFQLPVFRELNRRAALAHQPGQPD